VEKLYDQDNADKLTALGHHLWPARRSSEELETTQRAAERAPQSPPSSTNLALAYYQLKRFEEAGRDFFRPSHVQDMFSWFVVGNSSGALGEDLPAYQTLITERVQSAKTSES